jgi:hypothetical protein
LRPIRIGSHNENMARLLRLGFHSGTIPRLFSRLRSASRRALRSGKWKAVHKLREKLHHVEETVRRFVERELLSLLTESPAWQDTQLQVRKVHVACHQFNIELWHHDPAYEPMRIDFQDRGGWLLASLTQRDWLDAQPEPRRQSFLEALEGLYKYAGVDLIWDQFASGLGETWWWSDMNTDGLLVWRDRGDSSAVLVQIRDTGAAANLTPPPREIIRLTEDEVRRMVFAKRPIPWATWVTTWESGDQPAAANLSAANSPLRMQDGMPTP